MQTEREREYLYHLLGQILAGSVVGIYSSSAFCGEALLNHTSRVPAASQLASQRQRQLGHARPPTAHSLSHLGADDSNSPSQTRVRFVVFVCVCRA